MRVCHDVFARQNPRYVDRSVACCLLLLAGTGCFLFSLLLSSFVPTNNCKLVERNDLYGRGRRRMAHRSFGLCYRSAGDRRRCLGRARELGHRHPSHCIRQLALCAVMQFWLLRITGRRQEAPRYQCRGPDCLLWNVTMQKSHPLILAIAIANYWICVFYFFRQ